MLPDRPMYYEAIDEGQNQFFIETNNEVDKKPLLLKPLDVIGSTATAYPNDTTYVFRKMSEEEFKIALADQKLPVHGTNPQSGEKWVTESLQHTREFKNKAVKSPEVVAEFSVKECGYEDIRDQAIPQKGSRGFQPKLIKGEKADFKNVYNKERLGAKSQKINLGLKGAKNVEKFNKFVSNVTKVDPNSFVNSSKLLTWIRRNPVRTAWLGLGVAIDGSKIVVSIVEDGGKLGKSTQIELGKIGGGMVGATIGSALGTILPGVWNIILAFLGGLIGSLAGEHLVEVGRYLLQIEPMEQIISQHVLVQ